MSAQQNPLVAAMLEPAFYPHHPETVHLVQTHISYVFLAGDEVYKVKKPVRFTFLDFSTLEKRRHFCHEEVRLNRRLAANAYRGVVSICRAEDGFRLGTAEAVDAIEYAVQIRRLASDRLMVNLLATNQMTEALVDQVVDRLVSFHRSAQCGPEVTANGDPANIARILEDNFTGVRPFRGATIAAHDDDEIQRFSRRFLAREDSFLRRRQSEDRIREAHGDLHAEHICFERPLVIFDCIEFNQQFRFIDVASEIAFLAMDLEQRGRRDLAAHLIARYAELAGDGDLPRLVPFYECYRAYVRGKVASLKSTETEVSSEERAAAREQARRYFLQSYRYTWTYSPALVVVAGLSGSGKSTVAVALHERTGFVHLSSDIIRKELAGLAPTARVGDEDLYSVAHSSRTYAELFSRARQTLASGRGVILDATFQLREGRQTARQIAESARTPFLLVECTCPEEVIRQRLATRTQRGDDPSDADWEIYLVQQQRCEPFAEERLTIDTSQPTDQLLAAIEKALRARLDELTND